jgi:hypothetical protein
MICAAIPATAAAGAKLNADQYHKEESRRLPVPKMTAAMIGVLVIISAIYHTFQWQS